MFSISKAMKHFVKVNVHKFHVAKYCFAAGLYKQGILHDISKFSPVEFVESVKYYQGDSSPILAAKEDMGYSLAWQHHKGRNLHHYEYWQDDFDHGGHPLQMPFEYALELVCDYLGAGEAYMGDAFSFQAEYDWWVDKKSKPIAMHPQTMLFVDAMLTQVKDENSTVPLRKTNAQSLYDKAEKLYQEKSPQ